MPTVPTHPCTPGSYKYLEIILCAHRCIAYFLQYFYHQKCMHLVYKVSSCGIFTFMVSGRGNIHSGIVPTSMNLLTPWCRVLPEQLLGLQLVKKFPTFHGTRRFITSLTSARHLSLSCASPIQSIYPHPTSWISILILSTHLRLGLPSGLLPSGFPTKTLHTPLSPPIRATSADQSRLLKYSRYLVFEIWLSKLFYRKRFILEWSNIRSFWCKISNLYKVTVFPLQARCGPEGG